MLQLCFWSHAISYACPQRNTYSSRNVYAYSYPDALGIALSTLCAIDGKGVHHWARLRNR